MSKVWAYFRGFSPPYPKIAGPFFPYSQSRSYILSETSSAKLELSKEDIKDVRWGKVGACWSIESDSEPIWVGFIKEEQWSFDKDILTIDLEDPIESFLRKPTPKECMILAAGATIIDLLNCSQTELFPGNIDNGPLLTFDHRGDQMIDLLNLIKEASGLEYKIRIESEAEKIQLFLDFGLLENQTTIVISNNEILAGIFTRQKLVESLTIYGAGNSFNSRPMEIIYSDLPHRYASSISHPIEGFPLDPEIGIIGGQHKIIVSERIREGLPDFSRQRLVDELKSVQEISLSLDLTKAVSQNIRLGDIVNLDIESWFGLFDVVSSGHVVHIEPHEEDGTKDIILRIKNV